MFVAFRYLQSASVPSEYASVTLGWTAREFPLGGALRKELCELTTISAHLASAATRLATVDEMLKELVARPAYSECRRYFSRAKEGRPPRIDLRERPEWFHIMLRDVVGHPEPDPFRSLDDIDLHGRRAERKRLISQTTLGRARSQLRETAAELKRLLKADFDVEVPS